eukprot:10029386-Lingulodinium_polyedra.AAC.1
MAPEVFLGALGGLATTAVRSPPLGHRPTSVPRPAEPVSTAPASRPGARVGGQLASAFLKSALRFLKVRLGLQGFCPARRAQ